MGIVQVEELKLRQQEIEVKALVALLINGNHYYSSQAERKLYEIGFPEKLAKKLEQEKLYK